jgi:hypothetical protein
MSTWDSVSKGDCLDYDDDGGDWGRHLADVEREDEDRMEDKVEFGDED